MKYVPREIEQEVNYTRVHPLVNFAYLLGTVAAAGVAVYLALGVAATQLAVRMGPKTEARVGNALFGVLVAEAEVLEADKRLPYLQSLTDELETPDLVDRPPVQVHILDQPVPNAMAAPGGHILVTTGLLEAAETENEIAFVLAHELGHQAARDPLRQLGRSLVLLVINSSLSASGVQLPSVLFSTTTLADLHYSRAQETAADRYGLAAVVDQYGHGQHSLDFFKKAQQEEFDLGQLGTVAEWQSTHPLTAKRIAALEAYAAEQGWSLEGAATPLPW